MTNKKELFHLFSSIDILLFRMELSSLSHCASESRESLHSTSSALKSVFMKL